MQRNADITLTRVQVGGVKTTVQHPELDETRSHDEMNNGMPKPTERSEGGSDKPRTPRRQATFTEQLVVRIDKPTLIALEEDAAVHERTVAQSARAWLRAGANGGIPILPGLERVPYEETT